jgi:hypothetical protein
MELPETKKKLDFVRRREIISNIASTTSGQALREELTEISNSLVSIDRIGIDVYYNSPERIAAEVIGRKIASDYIKELHARLIPQEEVQKVRTHK